MTVEAVKIGVMFVFLKFIFISNQTRFSKTNSLIPWLDHLKQWLILNDFLKTNVHKCLSYFLKGVINFRYRPLMEIAGIRFLKTLKFSFY